MKVVMCASYEVPAIDALSINSNEEMQEYIANEFPGLNVVSIEHREIR